MIFPGGDIGSASIRRPDTVVIRSGTVKGETIGQAMANARLIVKAVNCHEELITALRGVLRRFETEYQTLTDGEHGSIYDWSEPHRARVLLAKLENNL